MADLTERTVAQLLGCPVEALAVLLRKGMIEKGDKGYTFESVDEMLKTHLICEIMLAICEEDEQNGQKVV